MQIIFWRKKTRSSQKNVKQREKKKCYMTGDISLFLSSSVS